jgi:hypothetical protein
MRPGADQIIACPNCQTLAKYMTLRSGNTFGARLWSDGKRAAPMLPRPPEVVKCQHRGECYWLADAEEIGVVLQWGLLRLLREADRAWAADQTLQEPAAWAAAQTIQQPAEEEYYQALDKGLAVDTQQDRTLRILAWWRRNDAHRYPTKKAAAGNIVTVSTLCRGSLEALASLLDEADDDDCLMKAEVLRELGEFESGSKS